MGDVTRITRTVNEWAIPLTAEDMDLDDLMLVVQEAAESRSTQRRLMGEVRVTSAWCIQELDRQEHLVVHVTAEDVD